MFDPASIHLAIVDAREFAPLPPLDSHVRSDTAAWIFLAVNTLIFAGGTAYAIWDSWRQRVWIPVMCMLGGVLCIFTEAMVDDHLHVWWPIHSMPDTFSAFGRHVPLMVIPIVGWYFGLGTYVRWALLNRFGARLPVWKVYLGEVAAAICLEPPAIQLHLWHYYGDHGFRFFGYPIWWPFVGGACGVVAGTLVYKLAPYLKGARVLLAAVLVPMGVVAVYWAAGLPMFNVLNKAPSADWIPYAGAFASIAFAFLIVWICTIATGHHAHRLAAKHAKAHRARVLVVTDRSAATAALIEAVAERAQHGPAEFTLLVPDSASDHGPLRNPLHAIRHALRPDVAGERGYDELIISTPSPKMSAWLPTDLPTAVRSLGLPVTTITASAHPTRA
jgi:hypothetical protein